MALRELVEGECGAANPLVKWNSHFSQEKSMLNVGLDHDRLTDISKRSDFTDEQLVEEFLGSRHQQPAIPQTFNMASLLEELQQTQQAPPTTQLHPLAHDDIHVREWVEEFATPTTMATPTSLPPSTTTLADSWTNEFESEKMSSELEHWVQEFAPTEEEKWVEEFHKERASDLATVAKEMTETVTDPAINATEEVWRTQEQSGNWVASRLGNQIIFTATTHDTEGDVTMGNGGYWDKLEKDWQEMSKGDQHPWLSDFEAEQQHDQYSFQDSNPFKDVTNPLEEGLIRLKEGDLPSAVLLFEAEVQARPQNGRGWQLLGSTQADNEQDHLAIAALNTCLGIDPTCLPAHMSLAVCYTNERQKTKVQVQVVYSSPALQAELHIHTPHQASQGKALESLRNWMAHHPKYSSLVPSVATAKTTPPFVSSFMSEESHREVKELYLTAAQLSPDHVDCDVQVGLGVLFHLSTEYDKAVDCFTAALQAKPSDAMLWNKLGATLANSKKSDQAVEAYRKALELLPGFTRCRYNLGISCINLSAYNEAVEHFLTALHLQHQAKRPTTTASSHESKMSSSIWSTLNLAVSLAGRQDLKEAVQNKDLDTLLREFGI